jgi:hypothetical protein
MASPSPKAPTGTQTTELEGEAGLTPAPLPAAMNVYANCPLMRNW